jgi:CrcB protein
MIDVGLPEATEVDPELLPPGGVPPSLREIVAAFSGGAIGTLARYGVDLAWPEHLGAVPHTTNLINLLGAFAAGLAVGLFARFSPASRSLRAFVVTGLLGGWTTMSAVAVALDRLGSSDGLVTGAIAAVGALALGVGAAAVGGRAARGAAARLGRYQP